MQFIRARNYTRGPRRGPIELVVLHTMESPEKPDTAENVARWFAGTTAPQASAHYCIDADSIVQSVRDKDIAWHAPGANHNGIGIELAGRAAQTGRDWDDSYSQAMLARSARLTAILCAKYGLPAVWLRADDLLEGRRGITTHAAVSEAFKRGSHWDPGTSFPYVQYLGLVRAALALDSDVRARIGYFAWAEWRLGEGDWRKFCPGAFRCRIRSSPMS